MREHWLRYQGAEYDGKRSEWVFHHEHRNRGAKPGDRIVSKRSAFLSAASRAKLPAGFRQHDLRHRRITTWHAKDRSPVKVQAAAGHAHASTTALYTHLVREHLKTLVEEPEVPAEKVANG